MAWQCLVGIVPPGAEDQSAVAAAVTVVDQAAGVGEGGAIMQSDGLPLGRAERLGGDHQAGHRHQVGAQLWQRVVAFGGHYRHRRGHAAAGCGHTATVNLVHRAVLVQRHAHVGQALCQSTQQLAGVKAGDLAVKER